MTPLPFSSFCLYPLFHQIFISPRITIPTTPSFERSHWTDDPKISHFDAADAPWLEHEDAMPIDLTKDASYARNEIIMWVSYSTSLSKLGPLGAAICASTRR